MDRQNCSVRQSQRDTIKVHDPSDCTCLERYRPVILVPEPPRKGTIFNSLYFLRENGKLTNALGRELLNYEVKKGPVEQTRLVDLTRDMLHIAHRPNSSEYMDIEPRENASTTIFSSTLRRSDDPAQPKVRFEELLEWRAHFI